MRLDISKFAGQKDLFNYLVNNKAEIIELKKSATKFSDCFGVSENEKTELKALNTSYVDDPTSGVIKRTIIANTYNWMDSHSDVHAEKIFAKSISERVNKIFHLADHEYKMTAKIGKFTDISEKTIQWNNLGVSKFGYTQALFAESEIKADYNKTMFNAYLNKEVDQHSVGMIYVDIALAVNDPEMKAEFVEWNAIIDKLGNRDKAEKQGFFFVVKEAKLKEISAVLEGSNELTPTLNNKIEPGSPTQKDTPSDQDTLNARKISHLIY